jgi:hypothetical protein
MAARGVRCAPVTDDELRGQRHAHAQEHAEFLQEQSALVSRDVLARFEGLRAILETWTAPEPPPDLPPNTLAMLEDPLHEQLARQPAWLRTTANAHEAAMRIDDVGAESIGSELERSAAALEQQAVVLRSLAAMVRVRDECRRRGWL